MSRHSQGAGSSIPTSRLWQTIFAEPLLHFALLGGLLYGVYVGMRPTPAVRIVVPAELQASRRAELLRRNGRPPADAEMAAALRDYVDAEMLFREANRRRLGEGDIIIRRRLIQKMEYLAEALLPRHAPTDGELSALITAHPERYALPERISLRQIFIGRDRHPLDAETVAKRLWSELPKLQPQNGSQVVAALGDPHPLGAVLPYHSEAELLQLFSAQLATESFQLQQGQWSRPLPSAHGFHLVQVMGRQTGQLPALAQLRERLRLDYDEQHKAERRRQALDSLRSHYQVVMERESTR